MARGCAVYTNAVRAQVDAEIGKRHVRRGVRADLRIVDFETTKRDLRRDAKLSDVVRDRRLADKLSHFMRWCYAMTKGMTEQEALGYVRGLLPRNLIGDHAYSHWELERKRRRYVSDHVPLDRRLQSDFDSTRFRLRRAIAEDPAVVGVLNRRIKVRIAVAEPRRLLLGKHDIDDFVRVLIYEQGHGTELRCVREIIDHVEKGGLAAALAVFGELLPSHVTGYKPVAAGCAL